MKMLVIKRADEILPHDSVCLAFEATLGAPPVVGWTTAHVAPSGHRDVWLNIEGMMTRVPNDSLIPVFTDMQP